MWESLARVNAVVGGVVWGPVGLALLFGTGCLLTVRTGFFQLRYFGYWMRHTIGAIFLDRNVTAHTDDEAISQFQSLCTALAATIGTGNIVGVAAAILAGGPEHGVPYYDAYLSKDSIFPPCRHSPHTKSEAGARLQAE